MASDSGRQGKRWTLRKTLARKPDFRPIEEEDIRYIYAGYKQGSLASMGGDFAETDMEPPAFKARFTSEVLTTYAAAWTLFAPVKDKGHIPVGVVLGFWSHPDATKAPFMILGDMLWFPWASSRNRVETAVHFFNTIRQGFPMVEYAEPDAKDFFVMLCKHGIMRRVGTSHVVYPDTPATIFETIKPRKES